jgi:hypothetical protein
VLSRALCRYRVLPALEDSSGAKRLAALELKIAEWSPWADTGRLLQEEEKRTGVWIWDREAVEVQIEAAGLRPERVAVLPETVLQPRGGDGLRHVKTLDGSEGQYWSGGLLVASRWWPEPPDDAEWSRFQRSAGVGPDQFSADAGAPESLAELPRPWLSASSARSGAGVPLAKRVGLAYAALGAAALILIGLFIGQSVGDRLALAKIDQDIAAATAAAQPRAAERANARDGLDTVNRLLTLSPYPSQLELWVKVGNVLPRNGTKLTDWNFQTGELEFTISAPTGVSAPAYVKAMQAAGFTDVSADHVGGDQFLKIKLKVAPR